MNRRGFIGALMASLVGSTLDPQALLWRPPALVVLPPIVPSALLTIDQITTAACEILAQRLNREYAATPLRSMVAGDLQYCIDMIPPSEVDALGLNREQYLDPAMAALADRVLRHGATEFSDLARPIGAKAHTAIVRHPSGVLLRGILKQSYSPEWEIESILRFDVMVAS